MGEEEYSRQHLSSSGPFPRLQPPPAVAMSMGGGDEQRAAAQVGFAGYVSGDGSEQRPFSSSLNLLQRFRIENGRERADVEQVQVQVRRFSLPGFQTQPADFSGNGSFYGHKAPEMASMAPCTGQGWGSAKYPFTQQGLLHQCEIARSSPNLKRKTEDSNYSTRFGSLSLQQESFTDYIERFYTDTGAQYGSTAASIFPPYHPHSNPFQHDPTVLRKQLDLFIAEKAPETTDGSRGGGESRQPHYSPETMLLPSPSRRRKQVHDSGMAWSLLPGAAASGHGTRPMEKNLLEPATVRPPWRRAPAAAPVLPPSSGRRCGGGHLSSLGDSGYEKGFEDRGLLLLLQKELRNSDVSTLGRIVLPKKEAESNLPHLQEKDGLILSMADLEFPIIWNFKYRYWPNNRSRMYIMENTGDFIRMHGLKTGDFFLVYKEPTSGNYVARAKKRTRQSESVSPYGDLEDEVMRQGTSVSQLLQSRNDTEANQQRHAPTPFQF